MLSELGGSLIRRAASVTSVIVLPDSLLIASNSTCKGDAGIFRSTDGGRSWQQVLASVPFDPRGAIAPSVPHELMVQFFRDVSATRQAEIFAEHRVARVDPYLGPQWWILHFDDDRSVSDLLHEFEEIPETDCVLEDVYLTSG